MYKYLDSLEAAENGLRRYIAVYNNTSLRSRAVYPMEVSASNAAQTEIYTGTKPEEGYYLIAVGISDEEGYDENLLNVTINGHATEQIGDMPVSEDYKYTVSSATQPGALNTSQVAPRVMQFKAKLSDITDGYNLINITNSSDKTQYVKWLEIFVDNTKGAEPLEQK